MEGLGSAPSRSVRVALGATSAGIDGALAHWGAIAGRIVGPNGRPVAGALVNVFSGGTWSGGFNTTTAADGRYRISALPPGQYAVCTFPYRAGAVQVGTGLLDHCSGATLPAPWSAPTVADVAPDTTSTVNDSLAAAGALSGTVLDSAGHPVRGAMVSVVHDTATVATATTNAAGRWSADTGPQGDNGATSGTRLLPGAYHVTVSGPAGSDYVAMSHPSMYYVGNQGFGPTGTVSVAGGAPTRITDTLLHGGTVRGTVRAADGAGIANAWVQLGFAGAPAVDGNGPFTMTAADGSWSVSGLPPGVYPVCISSFTTTSSAPGGFLSRCPDGLSSDGVSSSATLAEGATVSLDLALTSATGVAGTVTTTSGHPLRYSTVTVQRDGQTVATVSTDHVGHYEVDRLPDGSYTVCALGGHDVTLTSSPSDEAWALRCWGAAVGAVGVAVDATAPQVRSGVDLALPAGARIGGQVSTASGFVDGATVTVTSSGREFAVTTNVWGQWQTQVPAGNYTVCARATGHPTTCWSLSGRPTSTNTVTVHTGVTRLDLDIAMP